MKITKSRKVAAKPYRIRKVGEFIDKNDHASRKTNSFGEKWLQLPVEGVGGWIKTICAGIVVAEADVNFYRTRTRTRLTRAQLRRAKAITDTQRLGWLNTVEGMDWFGHCDYGAATRTAIDAAMKNSK